MKSHKSPNKRFKCSNLKDVKGGYVFRFNKQWCKKSKTGEFYYPLTDDGQFELFWVDNSNRYIKVAILLPEPSKNN